MNAKKALKKLKKKAVKKVASSSNKQLSALKNNALGSVVTSQSRTSSSQSELVNELKGVANQAAMSAAYELAAPLNPLLSWFNDAGGVVDFTTSTKKASTPLPKQSANDAAPAFSVKSVGHLPLKSPPCKRCPALSNGICKCAAKKFRLSA